MDSWVNRRYALAFATETRFRNHPNPAVWLCAQKRFAFGLSHLLKQYDYGDGNSDGNNIATTSSNQQLWHLPDFLLMVDDDTYLNIPMLFEKELRGRNSTYDRYVAAGCYHVANKISYPYGGYGTVWSRASLQRWGHIIDCTPEANVRNSTILASIPESEYTYGEAVCSRLGENLIGEQSVFNGNGNLNGVDTVTGRKMRLYDVLEQRATIEPFQDYKNWTIGYCYHSDTILSIVTELYGLNYEWSMSAVMNSRTTFRGGNLVVTEMTGNCLHQQTEASGDHFCNTTMYTSCHYQNAEMIKRNHLAVMAANTATTE